MIIIFKPFFNIGDKFLSFFRFDEFVLCLVIINKIIDSTHEFITDFCGTEPVIIPEIGSNQGYSDDP